jgi:hypothetical protein
MQADESASKSHVLSRFLQNPAAHAWNCARFSATPSCSSGRQESHSLTSVWHSSEQKPKTSSGVESAAMTSLCRVAPHCAPMSVRSSSQPHTGSATARSHSYAWYAATDDDMSSCSLRCVDLRC